MGRLTLVAILAVFFSMFSEAEANPFVYNYQRLRIVGLVCGAVLMLGGVFVILYHRCTTRKQKKVEDDNSEI